MFLSRLCCALITAAAGSAARADTPIVINVGAGITQTQNADDEQEEIRTGGGIQVDVSYRIHAFATVGIHVSLSRAHRTDSTGDFFDEETYWPFELGVGATFAVSDRIWIAPWFGVTSISDSDNGRYRQPAAGIGVGGDVVKHGRHRVTVFASVSVADGNEHLLPPTYKAAWVGAGYRFW